MNNSKYPQYLTEKGFARAAKKPAAKKPLTLAEKRVMAKRILQRQKEGISEEAAKMIAEVIKTLLHS